MSVEINQIINELSDILGSVNPEAQKKFLEYVENAPKLIEFKTPPDALT